MGVWKGSRKRIEAVLIKTDVLCVPTEVFGWGLSSLRLASAVASNDSLLYILTVRAEIMNTNVYSTEDDEESKLCYSD